MHLKTLTYRFARRVPLLLGVLCFILICFSNFSTDATPYVRSSAEVEATLNSAGLATIFGDNSDDDVHAQTLRANRRGQNVRRVCEKEFLKQTAVDNVVVDNSIPPADLFRSLTFGSNEYRLRPFYYVLLFRYALF